MTAAADPARPPVLLQPSGLGGAKALPGDSDGLDESAAMARGQRLHLLLELLPGRATAEWPLIAETVVEDPAERAVLLAEASAVITAPDLAHLFAPGTLAEVPLTARLAQGLMLGTVDRLLIGPDRVLAVDFKSNRQVPVAPDKVPEGLLRQMGAYAEALGQIYPDRLIETAILWTQTARLMLLDRDMVRTALLRATIP